LTRLPSLPTLRTTSDVLPVVDGDARRVVAPVLEATESIDEHVRTGLGSDVANDSAHGLEANTGIPLRVSEDLKRDG
jgi:hypothetical protein